MGSLRARGGGGWSETIGSRPRLRKSKAGGTEEGDRRLEARRRRPVALCIRERVRFLPRATWSSLRVVDETEEASVCVPVLSVLSVSGSVAQSAALLEELRSPAGPGPGSGEGRRAAWRCRWRPRDRVPPLLTETGPVPRRGRRAEESVWGAAEEPPCLGSGGSGASSWLGGPGSATAAGGDAGNRVRLGRHDRERPERYNHAVLAQGHRK